MHIHAQLKAEYLEVSENLASPRRAGQFGSVNPSSGREDRQNRQKEQAIMKIIFPTQKMFSILSFFGLGPNSIDYLADIHHMKYTFASLAEDQKNSIYGHYCRIIEYEREKRFDRWQGPDVPSTVDCDPTGIFLKY